MKRVFSLFLFLASSLSGYNPAQDIDEHTKPHSECIVTTFDILDTALLHLCEKSEKDYQLAFDHFLKAAKNDSLAARLFLIHLYGEGVGTKVNHQEAEKWMFQVSTAMKKLSVQEKVERFKNDFEWVKSIAEQKQLPTSLQGIAAGIFGYMYLRGWGIDKNDELAFVYLSKAVHLGNIFSNADLGKMYQEGLGVTQDFRKARWMYEIAATHGYAPAYYRLGILYRDGLGCKKNSKKAEELFLKAKFIVEKNLKNSSGK